MPTPFVPGGPKRFAHQVKGLRKLISTGGVGALLFDPGLGKTATTLDYASVLALKNPTGETRVLVVCPLAAVDTWVSQAMDYVSPDLSVWAEALGGSIEDRARSLASRGDMPFPPAPTPPPYFIKTGEDEETGEKTAFCTKCGDSVAGKPTPVRRWWKAHVKDGHKEYRPRDTSRYFDPRAENYESSISLMTRPRSAVEHGPGILPKNRLIIEVINLDALSSRRERGSKTMADRMVEAVRRYKPDLVVVDESHKIKTSSSNVGRLMARIGQTTRRRVILTGTVMPHSPLDVFGQWNFLEPYAFGEPQADGSRKRATFGSFEMRYAKKGGWMGKEVIGFQNLEEMREIMAKNAIVARKEDSLDLPPTQDVVVKVRLSPAEEKAYAELLAKSKTLLMSGQLTAANKLTMSIRLRQITAGYAADDQGNINDLGQSKVRTIASIVNDNLKGEKRLVVFATFTHEIDMLCKAIGEQGQEILRITGATASADRIEMRRRFGSDEDSRLIIVAQIKTLSLAVNELVTASHAVFASLSRQRDDYIQARDRLNRLGQKKPVTFWITEAPDTVDGVILNSHEQQGDLEASMLHHIMQSG